MSDFHIERELARHLAPVDAPASLWFRIQDGRKVGGVQEPKRGSRRRASVWILSPAVAAVLLTIVAGTIRSDQQRSVVEPRLMAAASIAALTSSAMRNEPNRLSQGSCLLCHMNATQASKR